MDKIAFRVLGKLFLDDELSVEGFGFGAYLIEIDALPEIREVDFCICFK